MPALPSVPQVLKVQYVHSILAISPAFVHVYLRYTGSAPAATDLNNAAGAASTAWINNYATLCGINITKTNVNITDLTSPSSAQGTNAVSSAGTRTGIPLAASACLMINQKIVRRYRGGKPRQYWPFGVAADLASPVTWTSAFLTAVGTALTGFNNALLAIAWSGGNVTQIVNVSYFQGFTPRTNPVSGRVRNVPNLRATPVIDPVTNHLANSRVATQRRREHFSA